MPLLSNPQTTNPPPSKGYLKHLKGKMSQNTGHSAASQGNPPSNWSQLGVCFCLFSHMSCHVSKGNHPNTCRFWGCPLETNHLLVCTLTIQPASLSPGPPLARTRPLGGSLPQPLNSKRVPSPAWLRVVRSPIIFGQDFLQGETCLGPPKMIWRNLARANGLQPSVDDTAAYMST